MLVVVGGGLELLLGGGVKECGGCPMGGGVGPCDMMGSPCDIGGAPGKPPPGGACGLMAAPAGCGPSGFMGESLPG